MINNPFFNAHHAPVGAFATFTLGFKGAKGGFGLELDRPANQNIYIGVETEEEGSFKALPFFEGQEDISSNFDVEKQVEAKKEVSIKAYEDHEITRTFDLGTDSFKTKDFAFTLFTPSYDLPDPETVINGYLKEAIIPAVFVEFVVDNSQGSRTKKAFFGFTQQDPYCALRHLEDTTHDEIVGVAEGRILALATLDKRIKSATDFTMERILDPENSANSHFGLGKTGAMVMEVPAGQIASYKIAICFYRGDIVTSGMDTKYYYTKFFKNIEEVAGFACEHMDRYIKDGYFKNNLLDKAHLSQDQKFMMAHAIKSYYGNSQFLECNGEPLWVINEGEYRMMNTFDLTIDQLFFELKMNPWTVKNVLEFFVKRYSYKDGIKNFHTGETFEGGRSFTHDMGVANVFSKAGHSSYEKTNLEGCFSYMTYEQLVNWVLCTTTYYQYTKDSDFLMKYYGILIECFDSMLIRDHVVPELRNGIMSFDSQKTGTGAEITTYDSLDISLGQARNNMYLGVKAWAAYIGLEQVFVEKGSSTLAQQAKTQAVLAANTISAHLNEEGFIPAVIDENNDSKIIPIIEGLIFPYFGNNLEVLKEDGPYSELIQSIKTHFNTVMTKGNCLFDDGGWKISSSSNNSWLSKVYLCQFVAKDILNIEVANSDVADQAHVNWLTHPVHSYWSWSDQIINGEIIGSRYYPRGVTSILWL